MFKILLMKLKYTKMMGCNSYRMKLEYKIRQWVEGIVDAQGDGESSIWS